MLACFFSGCSNGQAKSQIPDENGSKKDTSTVDNGNPPPAESGSTGKRGVCFSPATSNFAGRIVALKPHWFYTWSNDDYTGLTNGIEYVPMLIGRNKYNINVINTLNTLYLQGKIKYVLGHNEPDLNNITPDQAVADWEFLCANINPGIKLVAPVPSNLNNTGGGVWLESFMAGCAAKGLRVDFLAAHIYGSRQPSVYIDPVVALYQKYGKQIWVTEFAVRRNNLNNTGWTMQTVFDMMFPQVLAAYEQMPEVFRYSWFSVGTQDRLDEGKLDLSMLVDIAGENLTMLGEYYRSVDPNEEAELP